MDEIISQAAGMGAMPEAGEAGPKDDGKLIDLSDLIEKEGCYARNEASGFSWSNLFIGDSRLGFKSDADEQLILHIEFKEFVKVKTIKFVAFKDGEEPESNPAAVKVYVNRNNLGFEDIEDVDPTHTFELTPEDLRESSEPMLTKYVKFQRVQSLTFFIEENGGGEVSALGSLKLMGRPVATMNMDNFNKKPEGGGLLA